MQPNWPVFLPETATKAYVADVVAFGQLRASWAGEFITAEINGLPTDKILPFTQLGDTRMERVHGTRFLAPYVEVFSFDNVRACSVGVLYDVLARPELSVKPRLYEEFLLHADEIRTSAVAHPYGNSFSGMFEVAKARFRNQIFAVLIPPARVDMELVPKEVKTYWVSCLC